MGCETYLNSLTRPASSNAVHYYFTKVGELLIVLGVSFFFNFQLSKSHETYFFI